MPEPAQVHDASAPHKTVLADIHTSLAAIDDYCCAKCSITLLLLYILQLTELMQCRCQRNSVELVLWFDIGTKHIVCELVLQLLLLSYKDLHINTACDTTSKFCIIHSTESCHLLPSQLSVACQSCHPFQDTAGDSPQPHSSLMLALAPKQPCYP